MGLSPRSTSSPPALPPISRTFRGLAVASALWGFVTVIFGANVTFTGSQLACPNWPSCGAGGPEALIELTHRGAALILSLLILFLFASAVFSRVVPTGLRYLSAFAFLLVVAQALVGGAVILSQASPDVVILHLGLAVVLVGVLCVIATLANLSALPPRWQRAFLGAEVPGAMGGGADRPDSSPSEGSIGGGTSASHR